MNSGSLAEWSYLVFAVGLILAGQLAAFITNRVTIKKDIESLRQNLIRIEKDATKNDKCIAALKERQGQFVMVSRCSEYRDELRGRTNLQISGLSKDINALKSSVENGIAESHKYREKDIRWKGEMATTLASLGSK